MAAALSDSPVFGADDGTRLITTLRSLRTAATQFVDHAARRILATSARVVGCTSTFQQHVASLAVLRRIHELDPDVITMMGGANCETIMGQTTHRCFPWVDYVVSGEADGLITDLCGLALARGRDVRTGTAAAGVLGPRHREPGRDRLRIQASLPRALFRDLDGLPIARFRRLLRRTRGIAATRQHTARASAGDLSRVLVGSQSSVHVLWPEREQHEFPFQVTGARAGRNRGA